VNSLFGVCESLMPLVYGPMYSAIYAATMNTFPGTFFIAGGCMTMPAVFAFLWVFVTKSHQLYVTFANCDHSSDTTRFKLHDEN